MIRHIVLLKFRPDVSRAERDRLMSDLNGLLGHLKGVTDFHSGVNVAVETDLIRGNHDAFWFDFVDETARDAYLVDEAHRAIGARIVERTEGGIDGVTVFDIAI